MPPPEDNPDPRERDPDPRDPFVHGDPAWEENERRRTRDRWAEADAAWEEKWSDDGEPADAEVETAPMPLGPPRPAPNPAAAYGAGMREAGPYLGLGIQIAASMLFFVGLGYAADRWLGSSPWGLLLGAVVGMAGVFALVLRLARDADAKKARTRGPRPSA